MYALSNATVLGCEFNNNTAGINGGALFLNGTHNCVSDTLFKANTAINGSAIYLNKDKNLTLDKVDVEGNTHTDFRTTFGSNFVVGKDTFKYNDLNLVGLNDVYDGALYLKTIYVNQTGNPYNYGRTPDEATTLTHALDYIIEGGRIIFTTDYTINATEAYKLNNRTIIFVGNRTKLNSDKKYLFILKVFK